MNGSIAIALLMLQFAEPIECPWHCQSFQQKAVHIHMDHAADLRLGTIGNDMQDSTCDFAATSFAGSIDKLH